MQSENETTKSLVAAIQFTQGLELSDPATEIAVSQLQQPILSKPGYKVIYVATADYDGIFRKSFRHNGENYDVVNIHPQTLENLVKNPHLQKDPRLSPFMSAELVIGKMDEPALGMAVQNTTLTFSDFLTSKKLSGSATNSVEVRVPNRALPGMAHKTDYLAVSQPIDALYLTRILKLLFKSVQSNNPTDRVLVGTADRYTLDSQSCYVLWTALSKAYADKSEPNSLWSSNEDILTCLMKIQQLADVLKTRIEIAPVDAHKSGIPDALYA